MSTPLITAQRYLLGILLTVLLTLASACGPAPATAGKAPAQVTTTDLVEGMLKNGTYQLPDIGDFQLKNGSYEKKYGDGATQVINIIYDSSILGDLNHDGIKDGAVILWQQGGGSGSLAHLIAVVNQGGTPHQAATVSLGDRIKIKSLTIIDGRIVVEMLTQGPKDPMCCPSQLVTRTYQLEGNMLKLAGGVTTSSTDRAPAAGLTEEILKNGSFQLPDIGQVQLQAGAFERKYGEGATQVNKVIYASSALGDLNHDNAQDAAVILWRQGGGSGSFAYLVVALNNNNIPKQAAVVLLGDRIKIQSLTIENSKIIIEMATQGPNDPQCCPSQRVTRTYQLDGNTLKPV